MGEKDDFCMNLPLGIYARLNEAIQFIYDSDYFIKNAKAGIVIDNKRYSIPPMSEMSMRQYIDADVVMQNESDMQYIELLSVLLLTQDDKGKWIPYNGDYQELMGKVRQLKCSDALGLVYHFFQERSRLEKNFQSLYENGGGEPTAPAYTKFLKNYQWMHIISTLSNHNFLQLGKVLDENVVDVYAYLQYLDAKVRAENAQMKFTSEMNKKRK